MAGSVLLATTRGGAAASGTVRVATLGGGARSCSRSRGVTASSASLSSSRRLASESSRGLGATSTAVERASARSLKLAPAGGHPRSRGRLGLAQTRALPDDVDWSAVRTYIYATVVQFGLMVATLKALDFVFPKIAWQALSKVSLFGLDSSGWPQMAKNTVVFLFFLYMSFRSRIFSPLDNSRPTVRSETSEIQQRKRPSWMPPPIAFPFIWSTIGLLRAASSLVVWQAVGGKFLVFPLLAFLGHLCIGDTWNSINNVDKEYGVATLSMGLVLSSVYFADYAYFQASQKAGLILAPSCAWISVASFLVFSIWRMNLPRMALYPKKA